MILGLALALASAVATSLGFLFKHRGAVLAPPILVRHPLRSAAGQSDDRQPGCCDRHADHCRRPS